MSFGPARTWAEQGNKQGFPWLKTTQKTMHFFRENCSNRIFALFESPQKIPKVDSLYMIFQNGILVLDVRAVLRATDSCGVFRNTCSLPKAIRRVSNENVLLFSRGRCFLERIGWNLKVVNLLVNQHGNWTYTCYHLNICSTNCHRIS